ncbi:ATP-binding protein [Streptomyces sp. HD]|uniref:ATP-binding protein n=1 Tax=Streptomyces sp. HD TaxID=3020892 RepID=UPI00232DBE98|nr:ATP-binding protein [Streptomyces sp. HD]MDC0766560.1 ATP-binding protein [Streptomyces sp. HD]
MITAQLDAAPSGEAVRSGEVTPGGAATPGGGFPPGKEADHVFSLPHTPGAVSGIRRHIRAVLAGWNLAAELTEEILLVVSELLTNAIVHALPPATLRLSLSGADRCGGVRVEVTDMGPATPTELRASAVDPDEHGRGLAIVTALAARCGVDVHPGGTSRWAELQLGGS